MKPGHKKTLSSTDTESVKKIVQYMDTQHKSVMNKIPFLKKDPFKSTMVIPHQYTEQTLAVCTDQHALSNLEVTKVINWCPNSRTFVPLICEDDGNSLLHAISMYVFGVHDRKLIMRSLVYQMVFMDNQDGI